MKRQQRTKIIAFAAVMAALSNLLSIELLTIPLVVGAFTSKVHFMQLPIFISGLLAGPWGGLLTGAVGGLYMSYSAGIPFIIGGLALLGLATGFFAKRMKLRPFIASCFAWCVQAPYVFVTDYAWFVSTNLMPSSAALTVVGTILIKLTIEALVAATLSEMLVHYLKKAGLTI